jgi:hypothetical protein
MPEPGHSIDAAIERLLQQDAVTYSGNAAHAREQQDHQRLRDLSLATTSGDTLVIVSFPTGDFVDCYGNKVSIVPLGFSFFFPGYVSG